MPVMEEVVKIMNGKKESKKLDAVSLSNNMMKNAVLIMFLNRL